MAKAKMRKDLTGQKFGHLTALYVDEERSGNGKVHWICQCDCYGENSLVSVQSTSLTRKRGTKSCGCLKHIGRVTDNTPIPMVGNKYGKLTVTREAGHALIGPNRRKKKQWYCDCDCGTKDYIAVGESLRSGIVTSCGCYYIESRRTSNKSYNEYDLTTYDYGVGYCKNGTKFFFDKEDYDKIKNYCWSYDGRYVQAHSLVDDEYTTKMIRLHRVVLDIDDREEIDVDHINLVRYDCRKSNLRRTTEAENCRNKPEFFATLDNPVGISKVRDKFQVLIQKKIYSSFDTFDEAFAFRKQKEKELYGDFLWNPNAAKIKEITQEQDMTYTS